MNKAEIVARMAEIAGMTKKDAERALNAFTEVVEETLARGEPVGILGFGTFLVRERAEREGRNPRTLEPIRIPATRVPVFRPGRNLRAAVGGADVEAEDEED